MYTVLLLLIAFAFASVKDHAVHRGSTEAELLGLFSEFKMEFSKSYENLEEHSRRYEIFKDNYQAAIEYNEVDTATYGITQFMDLSQEEFLSKYASKGIQQDETPRMVESVIEEARLAGESLPQVTDWRDASKNHLGVVAVTSVKNQGQCGSCWSFSAAENMEGALVTQASSTLTSLSEQQLMDCSTSYGNHGCDGGLPTLADKYYMNFGAMTFADYPYQGVDGTCSYDKSKVIIQNKNYTQFPNDANTIAGYLTQNGPVSIGINASPLQFYIGDILKLPALLCDPAHLDHGVLMVGLDMSGSMPYWTVKNSWGASWGKDGYFLVEFGKDICGCESMASTVLDAYVPSTTE